MTDGVPAYGEALVTWKSAEKFWIWHEGGGKEQICKGSGQKCEQVCERTEKEKSASRQVARYGRQELHWQIKRL